MCGVIGYAGHRPAVPLIMDGLRSLEYRGYDSAGIAFLQNHRLDVVRAEGKLANLSAMLVTRDVSHATIGIGHTRWATHGVPAVRNAHPHKSNDGTIAVIHNGIIENYQELKTMLLERGYVFHSETDTEVLTNLISEGRKVCDSLPDAIRWAVGQATGAYALVILSEEEPGALYGARLSSPLIMGVGTGENFVASDVPAFLPHTRNVVFLEDGEYFRITAHSWEVRRICDNELVAKTVQTVQWDVQSAQKGGFKHFMLKEIFEQPKVITDCLAGRLIGPNLPVRLPELDNRPIPKRIRIVACGTSYNAGAWGAPLFEAWAGIPVTVEIASEFRYREPLLDPGEAVMVISQSGETADTLASLRLARERGAMTLGLCNVVGSSIARESDAVILTQAGPEISVASTKAMCSQMVILVLLALYYGQKKGTLSVDVWHEVCNSLRGLPTLLEGVLPDMRERAAELAKNYAQAQSFFFLGRGQCFPLALEGALKLKELSYIHAEGYASGEMKHGPIALIDPSFPTLAIALDDALFPKVKSNIEEVQARRGRVLAIVNPGQDLRVDDVWTVPAAWGPLAAFFVLPALQLFSYETADYLGKDVDQPRNLAKSVTVE